MTFDTHVTTSILLACQSRAPHFARATLFFLKNTRSPKGAGYIILFGAWFWKPGYPFPVSRTPSRRPPRPAARVRQGQGRGAANSLSLDVSDSTMPSPSRPNRDSGSRRHRLVRRESAVATGTRSVSAGTKRLHRRRNIEQELGSHSRGYLL